MGVFAFGPDVEWVDTGYREAGLRSQYAIHAQCPFRLVRAGHTLLGSGDIKWRTTALVEAVGQQLSDDDGSAYDLIADKVTKGIIGSPPIVEGLEISDLGDLHLGLSDRILIDIFPVGSGPYEAWRFLERGGEHLTFP